MSTDAASIRLNEFGYRVGTRALELLTWREKNAKRENRVLGVLYFIHSVVWKSLFGKQADSLEKSTEHEDECKYRESNRAFLILTCFYVRSPSLFLTQI